MSDVSKFVDKVQDSVGEGFHDVGESIAGHDLGAPDFHGQYAHLVDPGVPPSAHGQYISTDPFASQPPPPPGLEAGDPISLHDSTLARHVYQYDPVYEGDVGVFNPSQPYVVPDFPMA